MHEPIFAIIDTETTGMKSDRSRIIEVGIVLVHRGEIKRTFKSLVNPGCAISPFITSINGITDDDLISAPSFEEIALEVEELLRGAIFVAHNASFDYAFIKAEFKRLGMKFRMPYLCSVALSRALYPYARKHNLDALIERHGLACESRHRAYDDAHAVYQFMEKAKAEFGAKPFNGTVQRLIVGARTDMPYANDAKALPDTPGVYYMYGEENEPLYIGKSKNIRTRVRSHFSPSSGETHLRESTHRIEARETPGELSALLLESYEIKKDRPLYNRALRKRKKMIVAFAEKTEAGYLTARLSSEAEIDTRLDIAAVFRTMSAAREKLRELARENELCEKLLGTEKTSGACFGSQIEHCRGACVGKESPDEYNARFRDAFKRRRIKTWPFRDAIRIEERGEEGEGVVFLVKDWRIVESYLYDGSADSGAMREFLPPLEYFDYDTYKILVRYVLNSTNRSRIHEVSEREFHRGFAAMSGDEGEMIIR